MEAISEGDAMTNVCCGIHATDKTIPDDCPHCTQIRLRERDAEIEWLRAELLAEQISHSNTATMPNKYLFELQAERDEAREAARWLFANLVEASSVDIEGAAAKRWPWLEDSI